MIARPREATASRAAAGSFVLGLALLVTLAGSSCGDPDRAILDRLSSPEAAQFRRGRAAAIECWTCHDLAGTVKKVGPSLLGLYGRRSGRAPDYAASPAILGAAIVWDDASLAAFLRNPSGFVPGNRMIYPGIRDERALADMLFYLGQVTRPGARRQGAR